MYVSVCLCLSVCIGLSVSVLQRVSANLDLRKEDHLKEIFSRSPLKLCLAFKTAKICVFIYLKIKRSLCSQTTWQIDGQRSADHRLRTGAVLSLSLSVLLP